MFHVDVASAYVAMRRIPYKIINECHSKCFAAILAESQPRVESVLVLVLIVVVIRIVCQHCPHIWRQY